MKIVIIGTSGLLGEGFYHLKPSTDHELFFTHFQKKPMKSSQFLDMRDKIQVNHLLSQIKPDVVINTAAITNPETCEKFPVEANITNVSGTKNLATFCNDNGTHFIQVSTEYVFDGKNGPYSEKDIPLPESIYGETKLKSENITNDINSSFCIARTAMLFGWSINKQNLASYLIKELRDGKKVQVIHDQIVSPSYNDNIAEMLIEVAEKKLSGIFNIAGSSILSRFEFAENLCNIFNFDKNLLEKISISEFGWKANRPLKAGLSIEKISKVLIKKPMDIKTSLLRMKNDEKNWEELNQSN